LNFFTGIYWFLRCSDHSICPETRSHQLAQPFYRRNFIFCGDSHNYAVFLPTWGGESRHFCQLLLVCFSCFQYCGCREQSLGINVETSNVVSRFIYVHTKLGATYQLRSRSPGDRVPWWVLIWIKRSPLVFLVMSVACFSVGFCFFTYASGQVHTNFVYLHQLNSMLLLSFRQR